MWLRKWGKGSAAMIFAGESLEKRSRESCVLRLLDREAWNEMDVNLRHWTKSAGA